MCTLNWFYMYVIGNIKRQRSSSGVQCPSAFEKASLFKVCHIIKILLNYGLIHNPRQDCTRFSNTRSKLVKY